MRQIYQSGPRRSCTKLSKNDENGWLADLHHLVRMVNFVETQCECEYSEHSYDCIASLFCVKNFFQCTAVSLSNRSYMVNNVVRVKYSDLLDGYR